MLKEFREFAVRGNVVDMAVGVIVGASFGALIKALVDDLLMPPLGLLTGGMDFTNLLSCSDGQDTGPAQGLDQAKAAGAVVIA